MLFWEFLKYLTEVEWKQVEYIIMRNDNGDVFTAISIEQVMNQLRVNIDFHYANEYKITNINFK